MNKHNKEYDSYMKSEIWMRKRAESLEHYGNVCVLCGRKNGVLKDGKPILQVHHLNYIYQFGQEPLSVTIPLCPRCHRMAHKLKDFYSIEYQERKERSKVVGSAI